MKSLLFIVPSRSNGGTNSSLSAIYNALSENYRIRILSITSKGEGKYSFLSNSFTNNILNAYYNDFSRLNGKTKLLALLLKIFKRTALFFNFSIDDIVCKYAAGIIEKQERYDFIIGFQEGLAMRVASNFSNPNKYTWLHCDYERSVPSDKNELRCYDKFKKIVCVSQYTMHRFLQRYPTLKENTYYIYNLLDDKNIIKLSSETVDDSRFDNSCFTILSAGRMDPVKQFSIIPKIARSLIDINNGTPFCWYILGGPENDEYNKIKREIVKYKVQDYVKLLGNKNNPYPFFKASNLYVSTSLSEACPMVFNEARILGIPIVSSNFGSAAEFIQNGTDGQIGTISELPEIISNIINDSRLYHNMCRMCKFQASFNEESIEKLNNIFE